MTTFVGFLTSLGYLNITGVTRRFGYTETPPASLNAGELPASWAQLPEGDPQPVMFGGGPNWIAFNVQLVVAVVPTEHSTRAEAYQACAAMMDAVASALHDARLAKSVTTGTIAQKFVTVAGVEYWAVVADVRASG